MEKRLLLSAGGFITLLLVLELMSILELRSHLESYAEYWKERIKERGSFVYVALGDSTAQALGASNPALGYVSLIAQAISTTKQRKVRIINLSQSGARVADVLATQLPQLKRYKKIDLVTVGIGSNNIRRWDQVVFYSEISQLAGALPKTKSVIATVPYFGGRVRANKQVSLAGDIIKQAASANKLAVSDLYSVTRAQRSLRNYTFDFFHPNNRGYRLWFEAFWEPIEPIVRTTKNRRRKTK
jgi:acyl-CoA thioesterase-1